MGIISQQDYMNMLLRLQQPKHRNPLPPEDAVEEELPLHGKIMKWCRDNRAAFTHSDPHRKSRTTPGTPDFIIGYKGKVFWIEVKDRDGKRSTDQLAFALLLEMNGLKADICRSWSEFLAIIGELPDNTPH